MRTHVCVISRLSEAQAMHVQPHKCAAAVQAASITVQATATQSARRQRRRPWASCRPGKRQRRTASALPNFNLWLAKPGTVLVSAVLCFTADASSDSNELGAPFQVVGNRGGFALAAPRQSVKAYSDCLDPLILNLMLVGTWPDQRTANIVPSAHPRRLPPWACRRPGSQRMRTATAAQGCCTTRRSCPPASWPARPSPAACAQLRSPACLARKRITFQT